MHKFRCILQNTTIETPSVSTTDKKTPEKVSSLNNIDSTRTPSRKRSFPSYKMIDIYQTIFNKSPEFPHEAESDVQSMLKVAICTEGFLDAVDRTAVFFKDVKKAW